MSIERFFTTPVMITEPGVATTRNDDDVPDWDDPSSEIETKGWLTQGTATEEIGGRNVTVTVWILILPDATPITPAARVEGDGKVFEVDGEPNRLAFGMNPHVEARLRVVSEVIAS